MQLLAAVALLIEISLWLGLAIVGMSRWSWVGAVLAFVAAAGVWAVFMSPKGAWRLPPWPRALIALTLCVLVGMMLIDTGWPRWGFFLTLGGIVLGVTELVLPDLSRVRRDPTPSRHPSGL